MKQPKKKVSVSLDADTIEKLKVLAENDERTFSQYVNKLLKKHVSAKEERDGTTDFRL